MKVSAIRKDLQEGVSTVSHAVSQRSSMAILQNILISTRQDGIYLSATDLEMSIECLVPCTVDQEGQITIPSKTANEVLNTWPDGTITLESDLSFSTRLTAERSEYKLLGRDPDEYTPLIAPTEGVAISVPAGTLKEMIKQTSFAVASDDTRPILAGELLEYDGVTLRLVGTDTHRMAVRSAIIGTNALDDVVSAVVPARALNELLRIINDYDGDISITLSNTHICFRLADSPRQVLMTARLIEGQFPSYQRIIPANCTRKLTMETASLLSKCKRVNIVSRDDMNRVTLSTSGEYLMLEAQSPMSGRAHDEVDMVREGDDITLICNGRYLVDLLNVLDSDGVQIELTEPLRPFIVRPVDDDAFLCVMMPMASG